MEIAAFEHVCGDDGHGNTLQRTATHCNTLQHIAICAEMTDTVVALHKCVEQGVAVCCSVLQCVAVCCSACWEDYRVCRVGVREWDLKKVDVTKAT